ncbi:DUF2798 domain-containing protein [Phaeobacter sp. 22II1-1F12B]|uniref:DUF2798 domain-containing protein n=1 Tax=Phaeobacter sp. 22II1-1F12B TaxID=1317111 RepID=UPI000B5206AC|nr:DUF2798 domain-containing protein [Phaeobacter sp. 22II1-1F12B]OWU81551.1 hypothetical protein ATO1_06105 [Phaeobacter sp. 22II1-1F12B]
MDKKTLILTQVIMTAIMAVSMSGIMSFIALGPTALWLSTWPKNAIVAWPFAFVLGAVAFPAASRIANWMTKRSSVTVAE